MLEKSSTIYSNSAESFLPGICKELIGSSLDFLGQSYNEEQTMADSLINNFLKIDDGLLAISKAHEEQDEDSPCNRKQPSAVLARTRGSFLHITLCSEWLFLTSGLCFLTTVKCFNGDHMIIFYLERISSNNFSSPFKCSLQIEQPSPSRSRWQVPSSSWWC